MTSDDIGREFPFSNLHNDQFQDYPGCQSVFFVAKLRLWAAKPRSRSSPGEDLDSQLGYEEKNPSGIKGISDRDSVKNWLASVLREKFYLIVCFSECAFLVK